jgi:hypothetical protein
MPLRWTSKAGDMYTEYLDKSVPLYQISIDQDCRNSATFLFKKKFEEFLKASHAASASCPSTLESLAEVAGIHVMVAPGDNSKGGVFVPWRVCVYVAGEVSAVKNAPHP